MADVFDLYAKIRIDLTAYQNNLKRAISMAQGAADNIGRSFNNAEKSAFKYGNALGNAANEANETKNETEKYNRELDKNKDKSEKAGSAADKLASAFSSVAGKAAHVTAALTKGVTVAVTAASGAFIKLVKDSMDVYASFEQLEGGARLMFGKSADFIIEKSEQAYATVQLSQNEYLQQVNGFAIGLKTALGGNEQAAAELADKIVRAEADIVAATGNSQEAVQNAFNGIMRNNYTMLDNLQLGITPTKEGVEQLIEKVNQWNAAQGKATHYTIENLADIQSALVDYVKMQGLAGYASMEAGTTITGSIASVRAAWRNFLSGNGSVKNFTDTLIPTIEGLRNKVTTILPKLTEGIKELVTLLSPEIPPIIEDTLPIIIDSASTLMTGLAKQLPSLISTLTPSLISGVMSVVTALVSNLPSILKSVGQAIPIIINELKSHGGELFSAAGEIFGYLATGLVDNSKNIGEKAVDIITNLGTALTSDNVLGNLIDTSVAIIGGIAEGMFSQESLDKMTEAAPDIISNVVTALGTALSGLLDIAVDIVSNIFTYMTSEEGQKKMREGSEQVLIAIGQALEKLCYKLRDYVFGIADYIGKSLVELFDGDMTASELFKKLGKSFMELTIFGRVNNFGEGFVNQTVDTAYVNADTALTKDQWIETLKPGHWDSTHAGDNLLQPSDINQGTKLSDGTNTYRSTGQYEATPENYAKRFGVKGIPVFGGGGIVTKPTLALIGEDGAEAVVPLEKDSEVGRRFGGGNFTIEKIEVNVDAHGIDDINSIGNVIVQQIDTALRRYQVQQTRGQGGTAWA